MTNIKPIDYVGLHNHSFFSILDALSSPKDILLKAKELGQKAIAITDHGTLSCVWDALKASKETGVKLIQGCEFYFLNDTNNKENEKIRHLILIAKNHIGYQNLLFLNRKGFDSHITFGNRVLSVIDWRMLEEHNEGLICLTSCSNGILGQLLNAKKFNEAEQQLQKLINIFGNNLGLEVQSHALKRPTTNYNEAIDQAFTNFHIIKLAKKYNIKVVPTTNSHYINKTDAETHDVFLAIGSRQPIYSNGRIKYDIPEFYIKSGEEVKNFFGRNFPNDVNQFIENTLYFADLCEDPQWIDPKFSNPSGKELAIFPVKNEADYPEFDKWLKNQSEDIIKLDIDQSYLRFKCEQVFDNKINKEKENEYRERLKEELDVMEYHNFSSYMLIVADYINWAKNNDIRVGAGRGSCGGSLIAYLLGIHSADPIKYELIFARFHNKEKTSYPDIDLDFSPTGRDKVKDYIAKKYGIDNVAHVSNVNTITPKVFARDIARSCQLNGSREAAVQLGTEVADAIPAEVKSIDSAFLSAPLFVEYAKKYPEFKKFSAICGKYRAWSTHAGGLIISKRPLHAFIPLRKDKDGAIAVEFDKDRAEDNGLVKMDLLGLETLDIMDKTYELIKQAGKNEPIINYDEKDEKTYNLISNGDTLCVFQLGTSSGTMDLCKKIKPSSIEDISHINSLARPSAKDIRQPFISAKNGKSKVQLLHPFLKRAFGGTFGFGLYEESLMYLAQDIAGWSLHGADRLRKLTKEKGKNPKKVAAWRQEFIDDALKNKKIPIDISSKIWDEVIDKFQGYGFNLSHSILYSMTSYHTAYLKTHYPIEFLLANLISEVQSTNAKAAKNNIEKIKNELKTYQVKIIPPDINKSELTYTLLNQNELLTGLDALKFVSDDAIKDIIEKRPFKNFQDFMARVDSRKVRSNTIQALAASGSLDNFNIPRKLIYLYCSDFRKKLQVWRKKHDINTEEMSYPWPQEDNWTLPELYALETSYLGESFICGKKEAYGNFFQDGVHISLLSAKSLPDKSRINSIKAEIKHFHEFKIKKEKSKYFGQEMLKADIEDEFGNSCTLTIFPEKYTMLKNRIKQLSSNKYKLDEGIGIHFSASVNNYADETGLILDNFYNFSPAPQLPKDLKAKKVSLRNKEKNITPSDILNATPEQLIEDLEDQLFDEGLIELDDINDD